MKAKVVASEIIFAATLLIYNGQQLFIHSLEDQDRLCMEDTFSLVDTSVTGPGLCSHQNDLEIGLCRKQG